MAGNSYDKKILLALPIGTRMKDGTVYAGISPLLDGPFFTLPQNAPLMYTFNEAAEYAADLKEYGYDDWRAPQVSELVVMYNASSAIGGFDKNAPFPQNYFWLNTEHPTRKDRALVLDFNTGKSGWDFKSNLASFRPVRGINCRRPAIYRSASELSLSCSDRPSNS